MWQNPVYNRTQNDIDKLKTLKRRIDKKGFDKLSDTEKQEYLSEMIGAFSYLTTNRIEGNTEYIYNLLYNVGYIYIPLIYKTWTNSTDMYQSDFERLKTNIKKISDAMEFAVELPEEMILDIEVINKIEKALYDLRDLEDWVKQIYYNPLDVSGFLVSNMWNLTNTDLTGGVFYTGHAHTGEFII